MPSAETYPSSDWTRWSSGSSADLGDRKSTRLNSSHSQISYAVLCLKKKNRRPVLALGRTLRVRDRDARAWPARHSPQHPAVHAAGQLDDLAPLELLHHHLLDVRPGL